MSGEPKKGWAVSGTGGGQNGPMRAGGAGLYVTGLQPGRVGAIIPRHT